MPKMPMLPSDMGPRRRTVGGGASGTRWFGRLALGAALAFRFVDNRALRYVGMHVWALVAWLLLGARQFPARVTGLITLAVAFNAPGWAWRWLDVIPFYDGLCHLLMTLAFTTPVLLWLHPDASFASTRQLTFVLAALGIALAGGLLWELLEWVSDHFVTPPGQMSVSDTLGDLFADGLGGLLAGMSAKPTRLGLRAFR